MSRMKQISPEVFVAEDRIVKVDHAVLQEIKSQAAHNPRRRARLCVHKDVQDRLHEMLIVMARDIYIRPHKHPGKTESFHVIDGSADVVFFDSEGSIEEVIRIGNAASGKLFYIRSDEARYHTQMVTSEFLVVHEITNGPFNRAETLFAPWAPEETDVAAAAAYWEDLKRHVATR